MAMRTLLYYISLTLFTICYSSTFAQNVGINTNTPDPSAILDVTATDKGFLVPRVSLHNVSNSTSPINNPTTSLLVYNTNTSVTGGNGAGFYFFNGAQWEKINTDKVATLLSDGDTDTKIQVEESSDEDYIRFDVKGTEAMIIDETGNVGIAIDPQTRFHVKAGFTGGSFVDQQNTNQNNVLSTTSTAYQTFTAGRDGLLTRIILRRYYGPPASQTYVITLYKGVGTGSTALGSASRSIFGWGYNDGNFNFNNIPIEEGQVYTISINDPSNLTYHNNNPYPGGRLSTNPNFDLYFSILTIAEGNGFRVSDDGVQINDYTLPIEDGSAGQVLVTDGAGNASWSSSSFNGDSLNIGGDNWVDLSSLQDDGDWVTSSSDIYNGNSGFVGIGTATPLTTLHISADNSDQLLISTNATNGQDSRISIRGARNGCTNCNNAQILFENYDHDITTVGSLGLISGMVTNATTNTGDLVFFNSNNGSSLNETMRLTSGSTVGLGTATPKGRLGISAISGTSTMYIERAGGYSSIEGYSNWLLLDGNVSYNGNLGLNYYSTGNVIITRTAGNVGVGTTSPSEKLDVEGNASGDYGYVMSIENLSTNSTNSTRYNGLKITAGKTANNGANSRMIAFHIPGGNEIARINQNGASSVNYSTSSDIRLKTDINPTSLGIADLLKIEVRDYKFKTEMERKRTGFIAQQLYTIYPEAVSKGGEDVNADPWMVDYGQLTPLLVKAVQDQQNTIDLQQQQIDALTDRLNALEGEPSDR